ncbi:MAG: hypothetical protein EG824_03175 [Deltaproteobacteria bacterium]|nr:hypothetical protein [Deltaproteobacteria bacterium]
MFEENELKEQAEKSGEKVDSIVQGGRKSPDLTIFLLALLTILVLSISYFFVFALPKIQSDRLAWEKEQYNRQKELGESYAKCVESAEEEYESYIRLNATPVDKQAGAYSAPEDVWQAADNRKQSELAECSRRFNR